MAVLSTVKDLGKALTARANPAITRWNRLEGRPRTHHFDRALRAEVRDALWMLTKQWQLGEFRGDDAGSPMLARLCASTTTFDRYQPDDGGVEPLTLDMPLETKVERRPIRWWAKTQKLSIDLRLAIGQHWGKLLRRAFDRGDLSADYSAAYRDRYPFLAPDPTAKADAAVCAHAEAWQQASAVAGRAMDGFALLEYLDDPTHNAWDGIGAAPGDQPTLGALAGRLRDWLGQLVAQPDKTDAWLPDRLEYQFGCSAPLEGGDLVARAEEYFHGHLDWYALERSERTSLEDKPSSGPAPTLASSAFIPVSLSSRACPTRAGGSSRSGARTSAGCGPTRPISASCSSWNSA